MHEHAKPGDKTTAHHGHVADIGEHGPPAHGPMTADRVLDLQRAVGNASVAALLGHGRDHPPAVRRSSVSDALASPGAPLDSSTRTEMAARLGADFSDVRVHADAAAQRSAVELGARAYTSGEHVVVGPGGGDKHTLAHELVHVLQQRRGPVAGTDHGGGVRVSDPSDRFEREAEARAARAMAGPAPQARTGAEHHHGPAPHGEGHSVQRMPSDVQGAFGTYTMIHNPAVHPTGIPFLDAHVYVHRQTRRNIRNPWQSNFAVLEYVDEDTGATHYEDSFNVGSRSLHSEEVIFWSLNESQVNYRPVALFSDRKPCGERSGAGCMGHTIGPVISARARGYDVPVYYATDYPPGSQTEIDHWWR